MIQPVELKLNLPMEVGNGTISTTSMVWEMLLASHSGDLERLKTLANHCPDLVYAQYNYTPPIHFAVREGHIDSVKYLLQAGAHDPDYKIYPFLEKLQVLANDRGNFEIESLLDEYAADATMHKYKGDNGQIFYDRTELQSEFQQVVGKNDLKRTREILEQHPEFAGDHTYWWGEGILTFAAKHNDREMIDLLMDFGARAPHILKWAQFYYFEHIEGARYMMAKGMDPNTMSWHHVTLLHDMAQKGHLDKAGLLISFGADLNRIDEEYQSTPLGMAARWGQAAMVEYLLQRGADPQKAGASWSTPLAWARKKGHENVEKILLNYLQ